MSKCKGCEVRVKNFKKKFSSDVVGGLTLIGGAFFYCVNVYTAIQAGNIEGVSWMWSLYFVILNLVYCQVFWTNVLKWSFLGGVLLTIAAAAYLIAVLYY